MKISRHILLEKDNSTMLSSWDQLWPWHLCKQLYNTQVKSVPEPKAPYYYELELLPPSTTPYIKLYFNISKAAVTLLSLPHALWQGIFFCTSPQYQEVTDQQLEHKPGHLIMFILTNNNFKWDLQQKVTHDSASQSRYGMTGCTC